MNQYLKSLWLTETVRLIEKDNGRFQDDEANRQARSYSGSIADRIIFRAKILSSQHSLISAQTVLLKAAKFSFIFLILIAIFSGVGIGLSALAQNPINLYWALICLLGVHFVMLLIWLLSSIALPNESGSFFIFIWSWLTQKIANKNTVSQLLPAFISLFGGQIRWLIGTIVNFLWFIILLIALLVLVAQLSTQHYSFAWQTTLLSSDTIVAITCSLGKIPSLLGFTIPDVDMIRSSEQAISIDEVRSSWAVWLLGVFIVYGVLLRFGLFILCWLKWHLACQRIVLNTHHPEYQILKAELDEKVSKTIIDKENAHLPVHNINVNHNNTNGKQNFLVAIDVDTNWSVPANVPFLGFINNSMTQKKILEWLTQNPANKLLIAIDTDRSPDRGMINSIRLLVDKSQFTGIWFINNGRQLHNWIEKIQELALDQTNLAWLSN